MMIPFTSLIRRRLAVFAGFLFTALMALTGDAHAAEVTYKTYRFTATALRATGTTMIQLAEFRFNLAGATVPMTGVVLDNTGGSNAPTAVEGVLKLIDGNINTKWLDASSRPVIFDFPAPVKIDGYGFTTANDAEARDPISWLLEARNSPSDAWVVIDQRTNHPTTTLRFTAQGIFSLPTAIPPLITYFDAYTQALEIPFGANSAIVLNGSDVDLAWSVERATSVVVSPLTAEAGSDGGRQVRPPSNAETRYVLTAANAAGSLTKTVTVRSVAGGSAQFRYVRFSPLATRGGQTMIQLAEFEFYDADGVKLVPVGITNVGGSNTLTAVEGASRAIDGLTSTKWLDANRQPLVFDLGAAPKAFTSYRMVTGNDAPERDAARWLLEGSTDGQAWTLVDNVSSFDYFMPLPRLTVSGPIPVPGPSITPLIVLSADSPKVVAGQPLVLYWDIRGAATASINGTPVNASSGSFRLIPQPGGVYELTAVSAGGMTVKSTYAVEFIDPDRKTIDYPDFNSAGTELALLRNAVLLGNRLRLTPNSNTTQGEAWFRLRQPVAAGFTTSFGLHLNKPATAFGPGADGVAFIIQNTPAGSGALGAGENGLEANALNVKFDSWQNAGEPSNASVQVRSGTSILATVDLTTFPGVVLDAPPAGSTVRTLTSRDTSAPYPVRITYSPGSLNVFFNGVRVIENLNVDLAQMGAVDTFGTGFAGFSARTGGASQASDITDWTLTPGTPADPGPLQLLSHSFNLQTRQVTLTWSSTLGAVYNVTTSDALGTWTPLSGGSGIPGKAGSTSITLPFSGALRGFFRVERN
jgi:hypothetical protein